MSSFFSTHLTIAIGSYFLFISSLFSIDLIVYSKADSGPGSFRDALEKASANDSIIFAPFLKGTIFLDSPLPPICKQITIQGSTEEAISINARGLFPVLTIRSGRTIISNLNICHGSSKGKNGHALSTGGGGGLGAGGGLFIDSGAAVVLKNVAFKHNHAIGGHGGEPAEVNKSSLPTLLIENLQGGDGGDASENIAGSNGGIGGHGEESQMDGQEAAFGGGGGGGGFDKLRGAGLGGKGGFGGGGGGSRYPHLAGKGGEFGCSAYKKIGGGGAGLGGAVFVREGGELHIFNVSFENNSAIGGSAGDKIATKAKGVGKDLFVMEGASFVYHSEAKGNDLFLAGNGELFKKGKGEWDLNKATCKEFTGKLTVAEGTLTINYPVSSEIFIGEKGTLQGTGDWKNVSNQGILHPAEQDIKTIFINGFFNQSNTGTLEIKIDPDGSCDCLNIAKEAYVSGKIVVIPRAGCYRKGQTYLFLKAEKGLVKACGLTSKGEIECLLKVKKNCLQLEILQDKKVAQQ